MANRTATLYIRTKSGYKKHGKRLIDLPEGQTYQLFWYESIRKRAKAVGRFADEAQTALINKEAELRRAALVRSTPELVVPDGSTTTGRDFHRAVQQYLSEIKSGKSHKTHLAYPPCVMHRLNDNRLLSCTGVFWQRAFHVVCHFRRLVELLPHNGSRLT